jgi:hypothetical protein
MQRFRPRLTYANVMATIAVFAALGGGAYAAVSSIPGPDGVIHGCYKKKGGILRLVAAGRRCSRAENAIAFNQRGRAGRSGSTGARGLAGARGATGPRGVQGVQGVPGAKGETGAPGPGAAAFATTVKPGEPNATLTALANGVTVTGRCITGEAELKIETAGPGTHLQISGTAANSGTPISIDSNNAASTAAEGGSSAVDFDVIARDSTVGNFARIDVHGQVGPPCTFWGMVIPSG